MLVPCVPQIGGQSESGREHRIRCARRRQLIRGKGRTTRFQAISILISSELTDADSPREPSRLAAGYADGRAADERALSQVLRERRGKGSRRPGASVRLINFLVGITGKNETMAIGGNWSPSLDGADPERDRSVLVNTATRTFKALTGIDLSKCHKWYV